MNYQIFVVFCSIILLTNCSSNRINRNAETNQSKAKSKIEQIKKSGIVVIFPTDYKKEKAIEKYAKSNSAYREDLEKLRSKRTERLTIWNAFIDLYSFSRITIVPDSLLKDYIKDPTNAYFVNAQGDLKKAYLSPIYVLYQEYGAFEVRQDGQFLPNPFPSRVQAGNGSAIKDFLGMQPLEKNVKRYFSELDKRLSEYYDSLKRNPKSNRD